MDEQWTKRKQELDAEYARYGDYIEKDYLDGTPYVESLTHDETKAFEASGIPTLKEWKRLTGK